MSDNSEEIERYLDRLLVRLHGSPRAVRRMVGESEQHLYDTYAAHRCAGANQREAARRSIEQFGSVDAIAAHWNAHAPRESLVALGRQLVDELLPLTAVGLIAIGLSGVVERCMTAIWGLRFMFADPPGTIYHAADCRHWQSLHPHALGCTAAYLAESLATGASLCWLGLLYFVSCSSASPTLTRRRAALPLPMAA
jgi:hypothetical protein